jgi:DNA-binding transcriptional LysR family regulator
MDRLTSMAVFTKVAEANSFSAAARALGMSQATASKHVQMLESWLGARLLNRTTRRVRMTEIGEGFYAQCTRILEEIEDSKLSARQQSRLRGSLRIAAPVCFGSTELGPILHEFGQLHPAIQLDVFITDRLVDPLEDGVDLSLRLNGEPGPGLRISEIANLPSVLCAAPRYLAGRGAVARPEDLREHACLHDRHLFPSGWRLGNSDSAPDPRVSFTMAANNALFLREAAISGAGVLLTPEFVVRSDIAAGRLVTLLPHWPGPAILLSAAVPANRKFSAKIATILGHLAERMAGR